MINRISALVLFTFVLILTSATAQNRSMGVISYKIASIDTVVNKIIIQDSAYSKFSFKPYKTKWETGLVNRKSFTETIQNEKDYYILISEFGSKTAYHGKTPDKESFKELLNYADTSLRVIKTDLKKTIAGRLCKKIILNFGKDMPPMALWYDDTIKCNSLIPGAGVKGQNIMGLVLEYEVPQKNGKNIITAEKISFENVEDSVFSPQLKGYTVTELRE